MVELFHIGITHVQTSELTENPPELLVTVDCQDGESNVTPLPRKALATIDHHLAEHGKQEGKDTVAFKSLAVAHREDREMRRELESGELDRDSIENLKRLNLNTQTLRILGKALSELRICPDYRFAVAQAQPCDPNILGVISDQIMEVDEVDLCVAYCLLPEQERKPGAEIKFSVRSYLTGISASELAKYIANGLGGNAGGHADSAGGVLSEQEVKREITSAAEIEWDGFSSAVGRLIYREITDYCSNSSKLCEAYPEIAQRLDEETYIRQLTDRANQGVAPAQNALGYYFLHGQYVEKNEEQATKWFRMAAEQGLAEAQHNLALNYDKGRGIEQNLEQAAEWECKAAKQGLAEAQFNLGLKYNTGKGVEKDPVLAMVWFRMAAEQGYDLAQQKLGLCYYFGDGVRQPDFKQAAEWFRKAAEQGFPGAQYCFASCFYRGEGVEQDLEQAVKWFRMAAEQGFAEAQLRLGQCLYQGQSVKQDLEQAAMWFHMAAEQGLSEAQYNLGVCYHNGEGIERDGEQAIKWLQKAAKQGNPNAQQALVDLENAE